MVLLKSDVNASEAASYSESVPLPIPYTPLPTLVKQHPILNQS